MLWTLAEKRKTKGHEEGQQRLEALCDMMRTHDDTFALYF